MKEQALGDCIGDVGSPKAGHVHPICPQDEGRTFPALEERRKAFGLARAEQDAVRSTPDDCLDHGAQLNDVDGDIAHVTVVCCDADSAPIVMTVKQAVQSG